MSEPERTQPGALERRSTVSRSGHDRYVVVCCESDDKSGPYVEALVAAGAAAESVRLVTPVDPPEDAARLAAAAAGLMLCGGPDFEPWRYGEEPLEEIELFLDPPLDAIELALLAGAAEARTPLWAICRGMQAVNIFLGGTLYQHLPAQLPSDEAHDVPEPRERLVHDLDVSGEGGRLGEILRRERIRVNTRHHQAVKDLADGLVPVGWAADGVLEAMEWQGDDWWMWGVQWHPENLLGLPLQRELWQRFVAETRRNGTTPTSSADPS